MARNKISRFENNRVNINMERSRFPINTGTKTTFNNGDLVPFFKMLVQPGDTIEMVMKELVRMTTPIFPVMDRAYLDTYFFFVPHRLVWTHFEEFMGENKDGTWAQETEYTIPKVNAPSGGWKKGTIADYFGIPIGVANIDVSSLFFKSYVKIWNDWFRDQNRKDPAAITMGDSTLTGLNGDEVGYSYITGAECGGAPLKVAKFHDYFTSTLPMPQKGPDVFIPLGGATGLAPVITGDRMSLGTNPKALSMAYISGNSDPTTPRMMAFGKSGSTGDVFRARSQSVSAYPGIAPDNLYANLANSSGGTENNSTINNLRTAFAIQRHYEKLARGGSRYIEIIKEIFGVNSADSRLQRAEYLGGSRHAIQMEAVQQTSSTDTTSPQGNVAGNSKTVFIDKPFVHSFTEHGYIIGVQCTRTIHSYQQGINRMDRAYDMFDFYWPSLAHIGEQPVYNWEIYAQGSNVVDTDGNIVDDQVFGYQEAWRAYRYIPRMITGELRSTYAQSLDAWHYGDHYNALPIGVSSEWIDEPKENLARTLAVDSQDQFIADIAIEMKATRPMPVESVPGLIDHN